MIQEKNTRMIGTEREAVVIGGKWDEIRNTWLLDNVTGLAPHMVPISWESCRKHLVVRVGVPGSDNKKYICATEDRASINSAFIQIHVSPNLHTPRRKHPSEIYCIYSKIRVTIKGTECHPRRVRLDPHYFKGKVECWLERLNVAYTVHKFSTARTTPVVTIKTFSKR